MSGYLISRQINEWQWVVIIENCFHAIWKLNLYWVPLCQIIDRSGLCPSPTYKLLLTSSKSSIRINTLKFKKIEQIQFLYKTFIYSFTYVIVSFKNISSQIELKYLFQCPKRLMDWTQTLSFNPAIILQSGLQFNRLQ